MTKLSKLVLSITCVLTTAPLHTATAGRGLTVLDAAEETHMIFMREEEKLARDVYLTFAQWYPNQPVFDTVAM